MTERREQPPPMRGDEAELFERYADRLQHSVAGSANTSRENIEDACAFAWMQLFRHQPERDTAYNWLWKVAWREALRLHRVSERADDVSEVHLRAVDPRDPIAAKELMLDVREKLEPLPERERTGMFLRGMGYTYEEAAERLGLSRSGLNALLSRSARRLSEKEQEMRTETEGLHPRAKLLGELLRHPPAFLHASIGRPPIAQGKKDGGVRRLEWCRLALGIVDYRLAHGVTDPARPFGDRGPDRDDTRRDLEHKIINFDAARQARRNRGIDR